MLPHLPPPRPTTPYLFLPAGLPSWSPGTAPAHPSSLWRVTTRRHASATSTAASSPSSTTSPLTTSGPRMSTCVSTSPWRWAKPEASSRPTTQSSSWPAGVQAPVTLTPCVWSWSPKLALLPPRPPPLRDCPVYPYIPTLHSPAPTHPTWPTPTHQSVVRPPLPWLS